MMNEEDRVHGEALSADLEGARARAPKAPLKLCRIGARTAYLGSLSSLLLGYPRPEAAVPVAIGLSVPSFPPVHLTSSSVAKYVVFEEMPANEGGSFLYYVGFSSSAGGSPGKQSPRMLLLITCSSLGD